MTADERAELTEMLAFIEIPACRCPKTLPCGCDQPCECLIPAPPCRHVLSRHHSLSVEEWSRLLADVWPEEYADRPEPPPALVLSREARVAVLARRWQAGQALWNRNDLMPEDVDHLGQTIRLTAGNHRPKGDQLIIDRQT